MNIGMLWFDNDAKANLTFKISRAAAYYQKKYGAKPNLCFVHPSMLGGESARAGEVEVRPNRSVRPDHFWLGVNAEAG